MGGSSSSRAVSTTTNYADTRNLTSVDNSVGDGDRINFSSAGPISGVTIERTDHGAVAAGQALGMQALKVTGDTFSGALDFAAGQVSESLDMVARNNVALADNFRYSQQVTSDNIGRALAAVQESTRSETAEAFNTLAKRGMWVVLALAAVWLISKRFK